MATNSKLGKYQLVRQLGRGAMGVVFEGFDPVIQRTVAIKTIHKHLLAGEAGQELLARFKREAQAAGRLAHPNIVAIYEYGEDQGTPFIAMEFIQGRELKDIIKDPARMELSAVVNLVTQALDALDYVHVAGIVHRDLKPGNIILLNNGQVKIADFGIARVESSNMTQLGAVMGTPSYMSPEQFMGQRVGPQADLFSVGVILFELLTGEKPFAGQSVTTIMQKVLTAPAPDVSAINPSLPRKLDAVLKKALAKRPSERFQRAGDFARALQEAVGQTSSAYVDGDATLIGHAMEETNPTLLASADEVTTERNPRSQAAAGAPRIPPRSGSAAPPAERILPAPPPMESRTQHPPEPRLRAKGAWLLPLLILVVVELVAGAAWWFYGDNAPFDRSAGITLQAPPKADTPPPLPSPKTPKPGEPAGSLAVASTPPGAIVLINNRFMGITPQEIALAPGAYAVTLKREGFQPFTTKVEIDADRQSTLAAPLQPGP